MSPTILFITYSAYPLGGVATWLDYLVPGLENIGWNIIVGLTKGKWHNTSQYLSRHPFKKVVEIENKTGTQEGRVRSVYKILRKVNPDIVAVVNIPDAYIAAQRMKKKKNAFPKVVMTIHGIQLDLYEDMKNFRDILDGVICTNKLSCLLAEAISNIDKSKIYYAPYGVPIPRFPFKCCDKKVLSIFYIGRLEAEQKRVYDIPLILEELRKINFKYRFTIIGGGPEEGGLKKSLANEIASGKVCFLGILSIEDAMNRLLKDADVFLLTSSWETGPIALWEAMANRVAVVSSSYLGSGLEKSLKDNHNCLLFPVGDIRTAAECLVKIKQPTLRERLINYAYRLVLERYSRERSISLWHSAFEEILSSSSHTLRKSVMKIKPAGRLDYIFGTSFGESIRSLFRFSYEHKEAGGEWPHSYGRKEDIEFWRIAKRLDEGKN